MVEIDIGTLHTETPHSANHSQDHEAKHTASDHQLDDDNLLSLITPASKTSGDEYRIPVCETVSVNSRVIRCRGRPDRPHPQDGRGVHCSSRETVADSSVAIQIETVAGQAVHCGT